jgi:hypothetical protein
MASWFARVAITSNGRATGTRRRIWLASLTVAAKRRCGCDRSNTPVGAIRSVPGWGVGSLSDEELSARGKELADSGRYNPQRPAGLDCSTGLDGSDGRVTRSVLDDVRDHLKKYVGVMHDGDLDVLTLWAAHTPCGSAVLHIAAAAAGFPGPRVREDHHTRAPSKVVRRAAPGGVPI